MGAFEKTDKKTSLELDYTQSNLIKEFCIFLIVLSENKTTTRQLLLTIINYILTCGET